MSPKPEISKLNMRRYYTCQRHHPENCPYLKLCAASIPIFTAATLGLMIIDAAKRKAIE
jgi:hypothetical protein